MNFLNSFAKERELIKDNGGFLTANDCRMICEKQSINIEHLMVKLLPIAAEYSHSPISNFQVGAVAMGERRSKDGFANLYLGANFEYSNLALCFSVHAEQAAVSNAWLHDEQTVHALATSAAPCGHCRQFLYEVAGATPLAILTPTEEEADENYTSIDLNLLLPDAFGPIDLGCNTRLMEASNTNCELVLSKQKSNQSWVDKNERNNQSNGLLNKALLAANLSYAPYTSNFVGCALQLQDGTICLGRYAENAAHNPSLSAFSAALCQAVIKQGSFLPEMIQKVILVEHATCSSQKQITELLLASINPNAIFLYYQASIDSKK